MRWMFAVLLGVALASAVIGTSDARMRKPRVVVAAGARRLTPALRGRRFDACHPPERGFGSYTHWRRIKKGRMILPLVEYRNDDGAYDVVIHFHDREAVRPAFVEMVKHVVLVGIDLGTSSRQYTRAFERPNAFPDLLGSIERGLARYSGNRRAHIRHLALSSFSAGYGAVRKILSRYGRSVEAVILLDSLHSDYAPVTLAGLSAAHQVSGEPIASVTDFARRAAQGEVTLFMSHSQVVPPGYPSTSEVANYLINEVGGGARTELSGESPLGARLASGFDRADMHVRGFLGDDGVAHCAHVELLAEAVRDYLEERWSAPASEPVSGALSSR